MKQEPKKIYVYKMTVDNGGAPCVYRGQLSLAICKPQIRRMAEEESIIFGFGSKKTNYDERLIYIAIVTKKLIDGQYYRDDAGCKNRPDCIYEFEKDGKTAKRKDNAKYHPKPDALDHDVGKDFKRGHVLLSRDFRYFGKADTDYKKRYFRIKTFVRDMGRAYEVNHQPKLYNELLLLQKDMWDNYPDNYSGEPTIMDPNKGCGGGSIASVCRK